MVLLYVCCFFSNPNYAFKLPAHLENAEIHSGLMMQSSLGGSAIYSIYTWLAGTALSKIESDLKHTHTLIALALCNIQKPSLTARASYAQFIMITYRRSSALEHSPKRVLPCDALYAARAHFPRALDLFRIFWTQTACVFLYSVLLLFFCCCQGFASMPHRNAIFGVPRMGDIYIYARICGVLNMFETIRN